MFILKANINLCKQNNLWQMSKQKIEANYMTKIRQINDMTRKNTINRCDQLTQCVKKKLDLCVPRPSHMSDVDHVTPVNSPGPRRHTHTHTHTHTHMQQQQQTWLHLWNEMPAVQILVFLVWWRLEERLGRSSSAVPRLRLRSPLFLRALIGSLFHLLRLFLRTMISFIFREKNCQFNQERENGDVSKSKIIFQSQ